MRLSSAWLAPALVFVAAGCAPPPVTQLIVVVDTDLRIPEDVDHLTIAVTGPSRMAIEQEADLTGMETLPFTLTVVPNSDVLGPVTIVATATTGASEMTVVSRSALVTLARGETLVVLLHLARSCIGVSCPTPRETCTENGCRPENETPLYVWTGEPPRLGRDAGPAIDGGRDTGPNDGGPRDSAVDAPIDVDAGPDCSVVGCDDMNVCTDDVCNPTTHACEHRNLDIACDDGSFCNGFDQCGGGTCSVHVGNPCLGATVCDETRDGCTGCTSDDMCPAPMMADWGECTGFTDGCGNGGTHARIVRTYACMSDLCVGTDRAEAGPCTVDRTGASCMATSCSGFGACAEGAGGPCDANGTQSRSCTDYTCQAGSCAAGTARAETMSCVRATEGNGCGAVSCGGWSGCGNDGSCSTSGSRTRDCTTPICRSGACVGVDSTEGEGCSYATDGRSCGANSCDGWGACSFGDGCTTSGTRSRTCYAPVCSGGSCSSGAYTESEGCGRPSTDGVVCGGPVCGGWSCSGGFGEYECDQDGYEQRDCHEQVCAGGGCGGAGPTYYEMGAGCSINMDWTSCGGGGCFACYSGFCQYFC